MKHWFIFIKGNKRLINFGFLFNLFSSFGQTFFISIFVPFWLKSFNITNGFFGAVYAIATILSAFLLTIAGKYIDKVSLKIYGLIVFLGLTLSMLVLSQAHSIGVFILGLFLIRWFGQGLMTHTSSTGIAKYFVHGRGKALGLTALGHPAGQLLFPIILVPLIAQAGWRWSLIYIALFAGIIVIPSLFAVHKITGLQSDTIMPVTPKITNLKFLKERDFWIIVQNISIIPFISTAFFLYQYIIATQKGWDPSWIAISFVFYAIFNAFSLLIAGQLVDRFSGKTIFPLYLGPALVGLILIALVDQKFIVPLFYALLGISTGLGSVIKTSVEAEVFGLNQLGQVKSLLSAILVLSTALASPLFGYLIDNHISFNLIFGFFAVLVLGVIISSFRLQK